MTKIDEFSVLISVYSKEKPEYLKAALESIWFKQTLKPTEIIIVEDGPMTNELSMIIDTFQNVAPAKVVLLKENSGLGVALSHGIMSCANEIIARMDSDDISSHDRFEKQIPLINKGYDVVSSWSLFFEDSIDNIIATKKRPENDCDIKKLAKKRSPVSHAASILRKSKVLEAGNYKHCPLYEDYDLWVRMIMNNAKFYNLQDYVYYIRSSTSQFGRRGGFKYLINELQAQWRFKYIGFINLFEFIRNCIIRIVIRLIPNNFRRKVYLILWQKSK